MSRRRAAWIARALGVVGLAAGCAGPDGPPGRAGARNLEAEARRQAEALEASFPPAPFCFPGMWLQDRSVTRVLESAYRAGVRPGDRLVAVAGWPFDPGEGGPIWSEWEKNFLPGERVPLTFARGAGTRVIQVECRDGRPLGRAIIAIYRAQAEGRWQDCVDLTLEAEALAGPIAALAQRRSECFDRWARALEPTAELRAESARYRHQVAARALEEWSAVPGGPRPELRRGARRVASGLERGGFTGLADDLRARLEAAPSPSAAPREAVAATPPSEPQATEPQATEPQATEPQATEPQGTEPQRAEPQGTEPQRAATKREVRAPPPAGASLGSCFVMDAQGALLTAHSVVAGTRRIEVTLADGSAHAARLEGVDARERVAVLRIDTATPRHLELAPSGAIRVGARVFAIGFPVRDPTARGSVYSEGVLRDRDESRGLLLTSVPTRPGSAGSPLIDAEGRAIGVVVAVSEGEAGPDGHATWGAEIAFARSYVAEFAPRPPATGQREAVERGRDAVCSVRAAP